MVERDDEIKVLGEINLELQSGTHKVIKNLSYKKVSQEEALKKFNWKVERDHEIKVKDIPDNFYGFMYDTDDDASISGKSCEHFGWDWPENDSPDQSIQVVVVQNNVHEEVAEEVIEMANDQAQALSDQEVADECLDDEQIKERRPSKRIRVTQEEMVKDEKPKKG
ncbi:hypothetical protein Tco_0516134 [Tanacetum coccineum]